MVSIWRIGLVLRNLADLLGVRSGTSLSAQHLDHRFRSGGRPTPSLLSRQVLTDLTTKIGDGQHRLSEPIGTSGGNTAIELAQSSSRECAFELPFGKGCQPAFDSSSFQF